MAGAGDAFCPLRWSYLQVDLQHGRVKACCKTPFRDVSAEQLDELGSDAIMDSPYVRERRLEMLRGIRHDDCAVCWEAESLGIESYRGTMGVQEPFRSLERAILAAADTTRAQPRHVEILLRTSCDLACAYCGPEFSSRWEQELRRLGPYPGDRLTLSRASPQRFADTFRAWLTGSLGEIEYIQFNGGEPLIQEDFYQLVDLVLGDGEAAGLRLGIVSNLNAPPHFLSRLLAVLPQLHARHRFRLGVSMDATGRRAEYIRNGLVWDRFDSNLHTVLRAVPDVDLQFAVTMSALNVTAALELVHHLEALSAEFGRDFTIRPSLVMRPAFQAPFILLPQNYAALAQAAARLDRIGRWPNLRDRLSEIAAASPLDDERVAPLRAAFFRWFREFDARRHVDFLGTFPELADFWEACARSHEAARDHA